MRTDASQRFHRAIQMLSLAIAHVLHGTPDAARTNLRASWGDLRHSLVGRIEHMAVAAFVSAVDGNVNHAVHVLGLTLDELQRSRHELPLAVRQWVWDRCVLTMEYLPYTRAIDAIVDDAYRCAGGGNYTEALHQLMIANDEHQRVGHLTPPRVKRRITAAWNDVLERMLLDQNTSALDCVREFSARVSS